jgi:hypothetical protein
MLGVSLFPSQVLSDLNFFNVSSKEELASRLRAVQRVSAAAIGAYLMVRYQPILVAKLGSSCAAKIGVYLAFFGGYSCLSFPANMLRACGVIAYQSILYAESSIRNKEIGWTVIEVSLVGIAYFGSQIYKAYAEIGPNLLERLFQKVEDKYTKPLYRYFYTQTT